MNTCELDLIFLHIFIHIFSKDSYLIINLFFDKYIKLFNINFNYIFFYALYTLSNFLNLFLNLLIYFSHYLLLNSFHQFSYPFKILLTFFLYKFFQNIHIEFIIANLVDIWRFSWSINLGNILQINSKNNELPSTMIKPKFEKMINNSNHIFRHMILCQIFEIAALIKFLCGPL